MKKISIKNHTYHNILKGIMFMQISTSNQTFTTQIRQDLPKINKEDFNDSSKLGSHEEKPDFMKLKDRINEPQITGDNRIKDENANLAGIFGGILGGVLAGCGFGLGLGGLIGGAVIAGGISYLLARKKD